MCRPCVCMRIKQKSMDRFILYSVIVDLSALLPLIHDIPVCITRVSLLTDKMHVALCMLDSKVRVC